MKCPKCKAELKNYTSIHYCGKCGFPVNVPADERQRKLHSVYFDADIPALYVNGIRRDMVTAFSLSYNDQQCSLTISADTTYRAKLVR